MTPGGRTHEYNASVEMAKEHVLALDKHFSLFYEIEPVSLAIDLLGVDRVFTCRKSGIKLTADYKIDFRTADTGNAFVEDISSNLTKRPGWSITSAAQLLIYHIPQWEEASICSMVHIKRLLPSWAQVYRTGWAFNPGYKSRGVLVPWDDFCRTRFAVANLSIGEAETH